MIIIIINDNYYNPFCRELRLQRRHEERFCLKVLRLLCQCSSYEKGWRRVLRRAPEGLRLLNTEPDVRESDCPTLAGTSWVLSLRSRVSSCVSPLTVSYSTDPIPLRTPTTCFYRCRCQQDKGKRSEGWYVCMLYLDKTFSTFTFDTHTVLSTEVHFRPYREGEWDYLRDLNNQTWTSPGLLPGVPHHRNTSFLGRLGDHGSGQNLYYFVL